MTASVPFRLVDAFADGPFSGNPAGVCRLEHDLTDAQFQAIAGEVAASETAFLLPEGDAWRLRWFTPTTEVALCGHATLAAAHALFAEGVGGDVLGFHTRSGLLEARRVDDERIEITLPMTPTLPETPPDVVEQAFEGFLSDVRMTVPPRDETGHRNVVLTYEDAAAIEELMPHFDILAAGPRLGVIATAPGSGDVDFVSRFFAPSLGVPEDPVTGSAHCALAPLWAERLGKTTMRARQLSRRGGSLTVSCRGENVALEGRALTAIEGRLRLPTP